MKNIESKDIEKLNKKNKKKFIILSLIIIVLMILAGVSIVLLNRKPAVKEISQEEVLNNLSIELTNESEKEINLAATINDIESLMRLESLKRQEVGTYIMERLYRNKDFDNLSQFISYYEKNGGSLAIEALKYCYSIAKNEDNKKSCLERLTTEARKQGIIKDGEFLPSTYYILDEAEK